MRIGIDIDNTLVASNEYFEYIKKRDKLNFNKSYTVGWTKDECLDILPKYAEELIRNVKFMDNARFVLEYLRKKGHKLIIITARDNSYFKKSIETTKEVFKEKGIIIDEFYFGREEKSDIAKQVKIDLMIDDSVDVYKNMKKENIDCILFGDKIKNWIEVLEYIESRCNNG